MVSPGVRSRAFDSRRRASVLVAALVLVFAGCGGDDGDGEESSGSSTSSTTAAEGTGDDKDGDDDAGDSKDKGEQELKESIIGDNLDITFAEDGRKIRLKNRYLFKPGAVVLDGRVLVTVQPPDSNGDQVPAAIDLETGDLTLSDLTYRFDTTAEMLRPVVIEDQIWIISPSPEDRPIEFPSLTVLDAESLEVEETYDLPADEWATSIAPLDDGVALLSYSNAEGVVQLRTNPTFHLRKVELDGSFGERRTFVPEEGDRSPQAIQAAGDVLLGLTPKKPSQLQFVHAFDASTFELTATAEGDYSWDQLITGGGDFAAVVGGDSSVLLTLPSLEQSDPLVGYNSQIDGRTGYAFGSDISTGENRVAIVPVDLESGRQEERIGSTVTGEARSTTLGEDGFWITTDLTLEEVLLD